MDYERESIVSGGEADRSRVNQQRMTRAEGRVRRGINKLYAESLASATSTKDKREIKKERAAAMAAATANIKAKANESAHANPANYVDEAIQDVFDVEQGGGASGFDELEIDIVASDNTADSKIFLVKDPA